MLILGMVISSTVYAAPVKWSGNEHSYEYISGAVTWNDAKTQAESVGGYLATITSADENQFLLSNFSMANSSNFAWIGGYQYDKLAEPAGHWRWVTDENWSYTNWGGIEPNSRQGDEDYAMFNMGSSFAGIVPGQWGDATPVPSGYDPVVGYFVEYNPKAVPEPISMFLFGMGGVAIVASKKLRKK